LAEIILS